MTDQPTVLFVCVHNAGRSQMAAGYLQHLAGDRIEVLSAGSEPADQVNPVAVEAMARGGHRHHRRQPEGADRRRRAGAPTSSSPWAAATPARYYPGKRYEDWKLDDPAGQGIEAVRPIRDEIRQRVQALVDDLL